MWLNAAASGVLIFKIFVLLYSSSDLWSNCSFSLLFYTVRKWLKPAHVKTKIITKEWNWTVCRNKWATHRLMDNKSLPVTRVTEKVRCVMGTVWGEGLFGHDECGLFLEFCRETRFNDFLKFHGQIRSLKIISKAKKILKWQIEHNNSQCLQFSSPKRLIIRRILL